MKNWHFIFLICMPWILSGQCYPDRHNTSWTASWISCETAPNPNTNRGQSHWTMYDLGEVYSLGEMKVWNLNVPDHLNSGMRSFEVDYSLDGKEWTHLGSFDLDQAPGTSIYEGEMVTDWNGLQARYVIFTPKSNYGGPCVGFSEVRFGLSQRQVATSLIPEQENCLSVKVYPNPYVDFFTLEVNSECQGTLQYSLTNILGQEVINQTLQLNQNFGKMSIHTSQLPAGNYVLHIRQGEKYVTHPMIQLGR